MFSERGEGLHLNDDSRLFVSAPVTYCNDAFNFWGMDGQQGMHTNGKRGYNDPLDTPARGSF